MEICLLHIIDLAARCSCLYICIKDIKKLFPEMLNVEHNRL